MCCKGNVSWVVASVVAVMLASALDKDDSACNDGEEGNANPD